MLSLYYWNKRDNVGDYYGNWLLNKLNVSHDYTEQKADLIVCGSILNHNQKICSYTKVWGCGFHNASDKTIIKNPDNYFAVRGKLTYNMLGLHKKIALGDPGILISRFYNPEVPKKYNMGIVCHFLDYPVIKKLYGDKYHVISTSTKDIEYFVDEIKSCNFIFSSSLHGIIFSHAFGIPAIHFEIKNTGSLNNFKFKDYYSVLNIPYEKITYSPDIDLEQKAIYYANHCPSSTCINSIQEQLLAAFPFPNLINIPLTNNLKVCLGAIAKNENNYIREWVEHYKKLNFDKIFLLDNNDIDGERFDAILSDYTQAGFVEIIDVRGKSNAQISSYNDLYNSKCKDFDWVAFFDIDEFLFLDSAKDIKEFLINPKYQSFNCIAINWKYYDDNGLAEVKDNNYSVKERFTHWYQQDASTPFAEHKFSKRIMKTDVEDLVINSSHGPIDRVSSNETIYNNTIFNPNVICCNAAGKKLARNYLCFDDFSHDGAHLRHYRFKTIEEYLTNKMRRGYPTLYRNCGKDMNINDFFKFNQLTEEKLIVASRILNIPVEQLRQNIPTKPITSFITSRKTETNISEQNKKKIIIDHALPELAEWIR